MPYRVLDENEFKKIEAQSVNEYTYYIDNSKSDVYKKICEEFQVSEDHPQFGEMKILAEFNRKLIQTGILVFNDN